MARSSSSRMRNGSTSATTPRASARPATNARMWIAAGRLPEAAGWARDRGLVAPATELRTRVRARDAGETAARAGQTRRAERAASSRPWSSWTVCWPPPRRAAEGIVIDILIVHALATTPSATMRLRLRPSVRSSSRDLRVRPPVSSTRGADEALLKLAAKQPGVPPNVHRLLAAVGAGAGRSVAHQGLIEPLSERELEVLRLLESDLRPGHRPRAVRVAGHGADTHEEHLQPSSA